MQCKFLILQHKLLDGRKYSNIAVISLYEAQYKPKMSTQSHPTARQCTHKRGNYSWIGGNTSYLLAKTSVGFRRTVSDKVKDAKAYQYSIFYINSKLSFAFFWFPLHDIPYLLNWLLLSNKISSLNRIRSIKSPYRVEVACIEQCEHCERHRPLLVLDRDENSVCRTAAVQRAF